MFSLLNSAPAPDLKVPAAVLSPKPAADVLDDKRRDNEDDREIYCWRVSAST